MTTLLPPNATALERAVELLAAARTGAIDTPLRQLWSAADCPEPLLPWLAWGLSIDSWDPTWPLAVRRARVAQAIAIQRIKGTKKSVADVISAFGGNIVIREWFQSVPAGDPHTFQLVLSLSAGGAVPTADFVDAVISEVARTKPARSHFTFEISTSVLGGVGLRAGLRAFVFARVAGSAPASVEPANALTFGGYPLTFGGHILTFGS